jgi:hypothetical protein
MSQIPGGRVVALVRFDDTDADGQPYVHAEPGDSGTIVEVFDELTPTVRWDRTGTFCDVGPGEYQNLTRKVIVRG